MGMGTSTSSSSSSSAAQQSSQQPQTPPPPAKKEDVIFQATSETLQELILESPVPVLLDVYADWCGPWYVYLYTTSIYEYTANVV